MTAAARLLADAMELPESEREELAAQLLDSLEPPPGISIDDESEIQRRAQEAREGGSRHPVERGEAEPREVILFRPAAARELAADVQYYDDVAPPAADPVARDTQLRG
jgi:Putative addiction module component